MKPRCLGGEAMLAEVGQRSRPGCGSGGGKREKSRAECSFERCICCISSWVCCHYISIAVHALCTFLLPPVVQRTPCPTGLPPPVSVSHPNSALGLVLLLLPAALLEVNLAALMAITSPFPAQKCPLLVPAQQLLHQHLSLSLSSLLPSATPVKQREKTPSKK